MTQDLDLWLRPTRQNGERTLAAFAEFGAELVDFDAERFTDPKTS
jgi:hypothetical protein